MSTIINRDIIILGGGIAGLWLLNRLQQAGFDTLLLESGELGCGQTIASQGMIHGGVKYALSGSLNRASNTIADMPGHWQRCINGQGDIDLSGTRILSRRYFMWPRDSLRSKMTAFLGSKALRGRVTRLSPALYPDFFRSRISGPLYELNDLVLDVPSLLETLSQPWRDRIHRYSPQDSTLLRDDSGHISGLRIQQEGNSIELRAQRFILSAGAGNETVLQEGDLAGPAMQRRPLHMVMLRHRHPDPLYVHCVADQFTSTPELTITSHFREDGSTVWYLGGELAESGIERDTDSQIQQARQRLMSLFPWCDFHNADWHSFRIDRAEARQSDGQRPESAFSRASGNYLVCWPTKLTLAPALANQVLATLEAQQLSPAASRDTRPLPLPFPGLATPLWERCFP